MPKRYVLVDRDGTLNIEKNYLSSPEQLELIPGAAQGLRRLQAAGWGLCVVTNQAGIARGYFDAAQLERIHARLALMLREFDVTLDGIYSCPHGPEDACDCRKPRPGMIHRASTELGFDPHEAWVVGDKEADVGLGHAVGARSILVRTGYGKDFEAGTRAEFVVDDLAAAADLILAGPEDALA